ncbi:MAG: transglycosylase SLT domain-containing protein [Rikenellaceae bacterium]|nr:transglycosylase SLT domain-containing protein [Rikenellaceae bacterium]MCL2692267.1 transglycosylase SLT domain-containing protein [Rikenellaceae bacterium]
MSACRLADNIFVCNEPRSYFEVFSSVEVHTARRNNYGRRISPYDDVFRSVAEREGLDWRLLSAIAYHESRFMPHVISHSGARGIMQIMPVVARNFDVPVESITDTETNVMLAAWLLKAIENAMRLPANLPDHDRIGIIVGCYNAGIGHISDARRLARKYGRCADTWRDVAHFLRLKSYPEYYCDEVVRSGAYASGRQTSAFVRNVLEQYEDYRILAYIGLPGG